MDSISRQLSKFAVDLSFEDLPEEVVRYTKGLVLDTLGCAFGGYLSEPSRIARSVINEIGGKPECTIIGSGAQTSCPNAALANGVMVRYLDFNDAYMSRGGCHPSEIIPTALAMGEREHRPGKDVITAIVLGYEFQGRFADAVELHPKGFHYVTKSGFVAPLVAGRLLGINEDEMTNAIGIGGSHNIALAAILDEREITMMKAIGFPFGSHSGIMAALLAKKGFTGPSTIIESFIKVLGEDADITKFTQGGERFKILESHIKLYAAQFMTHSPVTATLSLVRQHNLKAEDIEEIQVRGFSGATVGLVSGPGAYRPANRETADHSTPYTVAIAILEGDVGPDQFAREQWKDPRVLDLMAKVKCTLDPELDKLWTQKQIRAVNVEIKTRKGETYNCRVDYPKGDTRNPMTKEELESKFKSLASKLTAEAQIKQIIQAVDSLEEMDDIGRLMGMLVV